MFARTSSLASLVLVPFALALTGCDSSSGSASAPPSTGAPAATTGAAATPAPARTGKPTPAECEAIPKHFLEVTLAEDDDYKKASELERQILRKALEGELAKDPDVKSIVTECTKDMSRKEYTCIMNAKSTKALDKCTD